MLIFNGHKTDFPEWQPVKFAFKPMKSSWLPTATKFYFFSFKYFVVVEDDLMQPFVSFLAIRFPVRKSHNIIWRLARPQWQCHSSRNRKTTKYIN